jgi:hypothetical protein
MSLSIRRTTAASLLILSAGLGASAQAGAASASSARASQTASPATVTATQAGAGWLGRQFKGHAFLGTKRMPSASSTAEAVLALAAAGVGGTTANAAIGWLKSNFEAYVSPGGVDDAGSLATVILAAQAMGVDPTAFGGSQPANNLVARLEATQQTTGSDAGLFGSQDPTFDGAFRQGLSLMALANRGISHAVTAAGVRWLKNQQCSDGGWTSYRSATGSGNPCPAPDPDTFSGPDTNSTALAVEGLVAAGASFTVSPTSFFASAQNSDGGFGYIGASSQSPDPDSTGEVIQALVALGQLGNAEFTQSGGATPVTALATFQLGCSASKARRGAFVFPDVKGPNLLATLQAVPGEAQMAFPLTARTLSPGLPKLKCPAH